MDFKEELRLRTDDAQKIIERFLPDGMKFNKELCQAMTYSVSVGGKRLRPVLMKSFYRLYGGSEDVISPFMAAMEMLHNYSLVHDDLPALDNDEYRRGMPATHKKYGEPLAILAGDGLLHEAYETAIKAFSYTDNSMDVINALRIFADKTGKNGMLGGQTADVINTGKIISDELMYYIYEKKTGALIEGAMMIGAALAGASEKDLEMIQRAGACIGMAFQIRDDILDIYGDEEVIGKPINSDEKNNKKTYVSVNGSDKSQQDIEKYTFDAVNIIKKLGNDDEERQFIIKLFNYMSSRER